MPIRTEVVASGTAYYTDDNHTLRNTIDAAKKNSPYYKKKKAAMERTQIVMVDASLYDPSNPDSYHDAAHVLSIAEKAEKYEAGVTQAVADKQPITHTAEEKPTNGTVSAGSTSSKTTGVLDGVLAIRLNRRLPTKDREWIIDPAMKSVVLDVTAEVRGLGGKATGAIVLGTDDPTKPAMDVVVFGTFGVEDEKVTKRVTIDPNDWAVKGRANIRYQVMGQVPTRSQAFALYDSKKALNYATIVQALDAIEEIDEKAESDSAPDDSDDQGQHETIIPKSDLLDQALAYVKEEPVKSGLITAALAAVGFVVWKQILS
jgi:hypothetical protein